MDVGAGFRLPENSDYSPGTGICFAFGTQNVFW